MLPTIYELRVVEERYRDLRREAALHRLARASHAAPVPAPSLLDRVRALMTRLHLVRPVAGQAKAPA